MRKIALLTAVVAAAMAFANVSSASALSWTPQGSNIGLVMTSNPGLRLVGETGEDIKCDQSSGTSWTAKASGAVMTWANKPSMNCMWWATGERPTFGMFGQWSETATSTSTVTLKGDTTPSGGTVMELYFPGPFMQCSLSIKGPLTATGQSYSNASHTLTLKTTVPTQGSGFCPVYFGKTLTLESSIFHGSSTAILP